MSITLNLNDRFKAELTKQGAALWNASFHEVPPKHRPAPVSEGHIITAALWTLMEIFGPHTFMGMGHEHFKNNAIKKERTHQ